MRKQTVDNPRYPHFLRIVRRVTGSWLSEYPDETKEFVIYAGPGHSYTDTTTTGGVKVESNKRKCSIPIRFDEWPSCSTDAGPLVPMSGDLVYVLKGSITEEWQVRDFEPDNNRSVVYGDMSRNLNM